MFKVRRWFSWLINRSPTRYRNLCNSLNTVSSDFEFSSVENLYEEIGKHNGRDLRDHIAYNLYLRQYFYALRDSRLNANRSADDMSSVRNSDDLEGELYQFWEEDLLKRPRGRMYSPNLPRICICSCEKVWQKVAPSVSFASWDAGWVFQGDDRNMHKLARKSCERVEDRLFEGVDG
ncbi:AAEL011839-PA [Aedes aegypti]|nr:AAEL011839-PA [Aedes aegypti]